MSEKVASSLVPSEDIQWMNLVDEKIASGTLTPTEQAYYGRIKRVYTMPDLSQLEWHPINMVIDKISTSPFYASFDHAATPQVVAEWETFDLFNFPQDHVARRPSDSYFIQKSEDTKESILLRPHTSVMWYHYLINQGWKQKLEKEGEVKALSWWKVYRVDELDKTHHECFHQIDGLRITHKDKEVINQDTLKQVLSSTIVALFGPEVEYRFSEDQFPYTIGSLEAEVKYKGQWIEVLWAWVVHPDVLSRLWIDPEKYNGWAFGFGVDRLTMALKGVSDIRIFWSQDQRITSQWGNFEPYKEVSNYPPVFKDITFLVDKSKFIVDPIDSEKNGHIELTKNSESNLFDIAGIVRDVSWDIVESVELIDIFENDKKFWPDNKSVCVRMAFRSLERTLTHEEINKVYFTIRWKMENELWFVLR